jgi:hypothetical protein
VVVAAIGIGREVWRRACRGWVVDVVVVVVVVVVEVLLSVVEGVENMVSQEDQQQQSSQNVLGGGLLCGTYFIHKAQLTHKHGSHLLRRFRI